MSEPDKGTSERSRTIWLIVISAAVAVAGGAAIYYYRGGFSQPGEIVAKGDPDAVELMQAGPLPDIVIGNADAPNTIVEYASMTCPHCAQFQTDVFPKLKAKYIDTGKAKYILREFPLDNLAVAAFMLARCAGDDRYYPMVDGLFETQEVWAVRGAEGKDKLLQIARQAGFSQERFEKCLGEKELFDKIVQTRSRGHERFGVESTPTFFINAKLMKGDHQLPNFDAMFAELGVVVPATEEPATSVPPEPSAEPSAETAEPSPESSSSSSEPSAETPPDTDASAPESSPESNP